MAKRLDAYLLHKLERATNRQRAPLAPVHDRMATGLLSAVEPSSTVVSCPSGDGTNIKVIRNLRGDTLAYLRDRKQIDEHQFVAGRHWQSVYEAACGTVPAMDTTKEPVDGGGGVTDGITDRRISATSMLLKADLVLKPEGSYLMRHIAATGITIAAAAEARGISAKTCGKKFRGCLAILAVEFGYADPRTLTLPVNTV